MDLSVWDVMENDWPSKGDLSEKIKFLLRYAILAPSGHNTQPWLFRISQNSIELYADRTRRLPIVDPQDRELIIGCGCALYFLKIAARKFAYRAQVNEFPDPTSNDLLASINIFPAEQPSSDELKLFDAILRRHTNRNKFETRELSQETINRLIATANQADSWLRLISDGDERHAIADLVAQGDRAQASNKYFRRELSSWVHPNRSQHLDGMPGYAFGVGDFASHLGPFVMRTFDWGNGQASKDTALALDSPVLAVLGSKLDTELSWLTAGQVLARILLQAASEGISASFLNQPIELEGLRTKLIELLHADGYPQILLRLGYGPEIKPTPRRGVEEILVFS